MHDIYFRAMGCRCRIVADGVSEDEAVRARQTIERLDGLWSRFRPTSEVSKVNGSGGALCVVSPETMRLFSMAAAAQRETSGLFDPFMLNQLVRLGYSRSFETIRGRDIRISQGEEPITTDSSLSRLQLFPEISAVALSSGCSFDPGGIGKGLAADIVTEQLLAAGATTAYVEVGGDTAFAGTSWTGEQWVVEIGHPDDDSTVATISSPGGAIATSSTQGRRWQVDGVVVHHILDPSTGRPADTDLVGVSVAGGTAAWAEVCAKSILIGGSQMARHLADRFFVAGLAITDEGNLIDLGTESSVEVGRRGVEVAA
ncbi:MAG: FAD:protein FMN transferase [Acidimicrobiales bacterium]